MPSTLSANQQIAQGDTWRDHAREIENYQIDRATDPNFNDVKANAWYAQANAISKQFYTQAIRAAFDDAGDAFTKLENVTNQAAKYVSELQHTADSWNKIATVGDAIVNLVTGLQGPLSALEVYGLMDNVAQAYTGDPSAKSSDPAP